MTNGQVVISELKDSFLLKEVKLSNLSWKDIENSKLCFIPSEECDISEWISMCVYLRLNNDQTEENIYIDTGSSYSIKRLMNDVLILPSADTYGETSTSCLLTSLISEPEMTMGYLITTILSLNSKLTIGIDEETKEEYLKIIAKNLDIKEWSEDNDMQIDIVLSHPKFTLNTGMPFIDGLRIFDVA